MIVPLVEEVEWGIRLERVPVWQPPAMKTLVLVPHPDDETLAAGGLIASLRRLGVDVKVVAVTDGEAAYGFDPAAGAVREREQTLALCRLGVDKQDVVRLRMPDSDVAGYETELVQRLMPLVDGATHVIAPWTGDFHPDHEACGRAAEIVVRAKDAMLTSYFFWTWHRGTTDLLDGLALGRFPLSVEILTAKSEALLCHASQLHHPDGFPILPEHLLAPARRPYEVYLLS